MKISANVIVYNEQHNIAACLDSLNRHVDEIILIHDGECTDKTLQIASKYEKVKMHVAPRMGEAEPHRPLALGLSTGDWVVVLDADERLPFAFGKLRDVIDDAERNGVDNLRLPWPFKDQGKEIIDGPLSESVKLVVFKKVNYYHSGKFHEWYKPKGEVSWWRQAIGKFLP